MRTRYLLATLVVLGVAPFAYAAQLSLEPEGVTHKRLDTFYVPVRLDTQGSCVNAVRVAVGYDASELAVRDVSIGSSILTLWTETPTIHKDSNGKETGTVSFEGGIPGGYCGRVEGDPGRTDVLAQLVVTGVPKALSLGVVATTSMVILPETRAYLNDGTGTLAPLTYLGVTLSLVQAEGVPENPWLTDIKSDTIAPEDFDIILVKGPSEGSQLHYIAFTTVDKQSGVDHYEVLETDPDRFGFLTWIPRAAYWVRGTSPYILHDQQLHSKIMVKAVDKYGNERVAVYVPPLSPMELTQPSLFVPLVLVVVLVLMIVALIVRVRRRRIATPTPDAPPVLDDV